MRIIITDDSDNTRDFCNGCEVKELINRLSEVSDVKVLNVGNEEYIIIPEKLIDEAGLCDEELMVVSSDGKIEICPAEDF